MFSSEAVKWSVYCQVDCMQFTEGKLQATCIKGHKFHLKYQIKKAAHSQITIQGSTDEHKGNKLEFIILFPTVLDHNVSL